MRLMPYISVILTMAIFSLNAKPSDYIIYRNKDGQSISINKEEAIVKGNRYIASDCSSASMYCLNYSGYFSLIAPKNCSEIHGKPWRLGGFSATNLGVDLHRSRTMYGVNDGEMVAYIYSWGGDGIVGLAFDSRNKIGNINALHAMGYRDPSIFYEKISSGNFLACTDSG